MIAAGAVFGAYGTLIGAGGGTLIVPFLLLTHPIEPHLAAGTSLLAVFLNAVAGSLSYARQGRIDVRAGLILALATLPGAVIGGIVTPRIAGTVFRRIFGVLLFSLAVYVWLRPAPRNPSPPAKGSSRWAVRQHISGSGQLVTYSFSWPLGLLTSFVIGFISSFFGIGGGVIQVPVLVHLLHFPAHIATATSLFIMVFTAAAGSFTYGVQDHILWGMALALGLGVIGGAPLGARISRRVQSAWIMRLLTLALAAVGVRLFWG